ncbi:type VII secretion-associated serine protease mycosin [Amycolatopsis bartoniae]|uniref:Type VII secretion-associated serine protease n=1 Tax=Amycolatopsis bartoniae TaxID=941986 RepID=A0A8H9ISB4_9PSEU|nr:type VII secretion-associated serine protease mycosin [Amycolatopsis bartoniae]MBB2934780.1 type VII secretion-associated serine protease mycosin [Amycolatopsis bartoniae]TVT02431.1 type VII secretion-associated serine protease mycosin [Amycolatopsis bartoniae]GHF44780.1 type VII secretion-associated serine protease [Amycolatopsis bartoniae]
MRARRLSALTGSVLLLGVLSAGPAAAQQTATPLPNNQQACLPPPQGTETSVPWAQQQLAPQRVWPLTRGGGITVAVVDTGVDAHTPQLAGHVQRGVDITTSSHGPADSDCYGHGTFLAGIIAAASAPGTGFAGVAPDVSILPIRVANSAGDNSPGALTADSMARGIRQAVDSGAQVVNISASTTVPNADLQAAVQYAASRDVVVVASAANSAEDGDPVTYPASYPGVIAVGAVDANGQRANFSQTGPFLSLVAPGVDVTSIGPGGPGQWQGSGTSYAAPFVAAAAALVRAYRPTLTAAQVKHRLEATANHPAAALPDPGLGWGTVNLMAAVTTVLPEEGGAGAQVMVTPPPVRPANVQAPDELGPLLAVAGVMVAAIFAFALVRVSRLSRGGRRRGWRPARVVEVVSPKPAAGAGADSEPVGSGSAGVLGRKD